MKPKHLRFNDFLNEHNQSNIYYLDENDHFIHLTWKTYFSIVQQISTFIKKNFDVEQARFAIYHNKAFIWDLCNYALKINSMAIMGLNHFDNLKQIKTLMTGINIDVVVCAEDQLMQVQSFWPKSILVVNLDDKLNLSIRLENKEALTSSRQNISCDVCEILSTSGTTGVPKFYQFSEQQILMACDAISSFYQTELTKLERTISWMPLANPFQRILNLVSLIENKTIYYINDPKKIVHYCKQAQIEYLASIPRFYEKVYEGLKTTFCSIPLFKKYFTFVFKKLSQSQLSVQDKFKILGMQVILKYFVKLSLSRQLRFLISGSAPLPLWLDCFFKHINLPIYQAYGLSENIIPICLSNRKYRKLGSAGRVLPMNQVLIKKEQIYVRSPGINLEYLHDHPQEYLATGDQGSLDEDGFIFITGRQVDFFKTSTGRKIYPNKIEQSLKQLTAVNFVCIIGENFKYPIAIIDVNNDFRKHFKNVSEVTQEASALMSPFNDYEIPKLIIIVTNAFSIENGEITSNLKLRRKQIAKSYMPIAKKILEERGNNKPIRVEFY